MNIQNILKEFVKECSKKLKLKTITQIGSSVVSTKSKDIDIVLISKENIFPTGDIIKLYKICWSFEKKHPSIAFDIGGDRIKKAKMQITLALIDGDFNMMTKFYPFFMKSLIEDSTKKILYGPKKFPHIKIKIPKDEIMHSVSNSLGFFFRKFLDPSYDKEHISSMFKEILRFMLANKTGKKKSYELLEEFHKTYPKIKTPSRSKEILSHKVRKDDLIESLKFGENCLKYLRKGK